MTTLREASFSTINLLPNNNSNTARSLPERHVKVQGAQACLTVPRELRTALGYYIKTKSYTTKRVSLGESCGGLMYRY